MDQQAPGTSHAPVQFTHREILTAFTGIGLSIIMASMDQTIVATALPTIAHNLGSLESMSWVVTSYMLASTATAPIYGRLSDLYGRRTLLQIAIVVFLAGSLLCGAAGSMGQLILFRAIQGLGGGGLVSLSLTIVGDLVSPRERGRYQGYIAGMFAVSSVIAPLLGGLLVDHASWRLIFLINLPVSFGALFLTHRTLGRLGSGHREEAGIDYLGAALLMGAVVTFLLMLSDLAHHNLWESPEDLGLLILTPILIIGFVWQEKRAKAPILPLRLFTNPLFRVAVPITMINAMVMFAGAIYLPIQMQLVGGAGAQSAGTLMLPFSLGISAGSAGAGRYVSHSGRYKILPASGLFIAACGYLLLGLTGSTLATSLESILLVVLGIGLGFVMPTMTVSLQNAVERRDLGAATSAVGFFRSLGGSIGVALFGAIMLALMKGKGSNVGEGAKSGAEALMALPAAERIQAAVAYAGAFDAIFLTAAAIAFAGFILTLFVKELPLRTERH